jgi:tRNA threonylcarbamoyladenosine biosynthesis protein TsaE
LHTDHLNPAIQNRFLADETATLQFGAELAEAIQPGLVIHLSGDLGAGKTTLARGLLRALGHHGRVKSPTFALVEVYELSRLYFYHFDFYRFDEPNDWAAAGFRDYFTPESVCLIEWPEKAPTLPPADIHIAIRIAGDGRIVEWRTGTEVGSLCLARIQH